MASLGWLKLFCSSEGDFSYIYLDVRELVIYPTSVRVGKNTKRKDPILEEMSEGTTKEIGGITKGKEDIKKETETGGRREAVEIH